MTNFNFLTGPFADFLESATEAEKNAFAAPRVSAFYNRLALESAVSGYTIMMMNWNVPIGIT